MTDHELHGRLRRWHVAEATGEPAPVSLWASVADIPTLGEAGRRTPQVAHALLVAALIVAAAVAGAIAIASQPDSELVDRSLDPASLNPCQLLPGPGPGVRELAEPILHEGAAVVGGQSCAYGWDDGSNLHLQVRNQSTTDADVPAIVGSIFSGGGNEGGGPIRFTVDGHPAWFGRAAWTRPPTATGSPRGTDDCVAAAVSSDPYFFVLWLTCRQTGRDTGQPSIGELSMDAWADYRMWAEEVAHGVLANLVALNAGDDPPYRVGRTR
jgi:hypothetical protein